MSLFWKIQKDRVAPKLMERYTSLAKGGNPDFIANHPNLVKELLNDDIKNKIETKKYIEKKIERDFKYGHVPKPSVIIKRLNR